MDGAMAQWLGCWISNIGGLQLKLLDGSKVNSAFHSFEVNQMNTRNFRELVDKSKLSPCSDSAALLNS